MKIMIDIPQKTYNHVFDNAGISNNDLREILLAISKSVILSDEQIESIIESKDKE